MTARGACSAGVSRAPGRTAPGLASRLQTTPRVAQERDEGTMRRRGFPYRMVVKWCDAERAFIARVPALPAFAARGHTEAEASEIARAAAEAILAVMRADGQPIPAPEMLAEAGAARGR